MKGLLAPRGIGPRTARRALHAIKPFALERFFADYEFTAPHQLCCSDVEALTMAEVLALADPEMTRAFESLSLGYTESRGSPALLEAVAATYDSALVGPLAPVTAAPQEAILLAMNALLEPGDRAIVMHPSYQSLYEIAVASGVQVTRWVPQPGPAPTQFAVDDLARLLEELPAPPKLVVVNAPHNPTGFLPTEGEWRTIVELCAARGSWLFADEMYRGLETNPAHRLPNAVDTGYERAISLSGVSKALALPGLRIGWLAACNQQFLDRVCELKDYTTICSSAPSEVLATIALRNRDHLLARSQEICKSNLSALRAFFARHPDRFAWQEPKAGSICFPRLQQLQSSDQVEDYCRWLVEEHGILLLPASVYGFDEPCFRVGFGRRNMKAILPLWERTF